ncbi:MAG: bis(5'-nucleosyl)-tetraphosphatase (symmetrical) YqeK [Clostridia bacterium]|nr:bis(5'-nucleosyl)-tetraphosphatase (symmetrical) YqeK [Clostridia bacterium]
MFNLEKEIRPLMSNYRYNHTLSVVSECKNLAELFGIDGEKLIASAYLHDITKEMPTDSQLLLCEKMGIEIDKDTLNSPKTLHSFTAPALIMSDFPQYADKEILSAVRYHTTGRANMTLTEKLLYLADYIEPTRKFDECKRLREYFYADTCDIQKRLNDTIVLSLKYTISELLEKKEFIHSQTLECYNSLIKRIGD